MAALPRPSHAEPAGDGAQGAREALAAIVRTIFAQPDHATAMAQLQKVAEELRPRFPRTARLLDEAAEDVLADRLFLSEHQRQLHSTNVLERLNKEIKRRSNVVGIFPISVTHTMILQGYDCHWVVFRLALWRTRPVGGTDGSDRKPDINKRNDSKHPA